MRSRAVTVLVVLVALLVGGLALPSASATRTWPTVELSSDGREWSPDLAEPLFGDGFVWVPGCVATRTFYARNQGADPARLDLTLVVAGQDQPRRDDGFRFAVRLGVGAWHVVRRDAAGPVSLMLARAAVVLVQVRVRMVRRATNASMGQHLAIAIAVGSTRRATEGGARP